LAVSRKRIVHALRSSGVLSKSTLITLEMDTYFDPIIAHV